MKILQKAAWVLDLEGQAILTAKERLNEEFEKAVHLLLACKGKIVVTGLGKSGHIARKIAATLASTGSSAFFLHPSEALHGDLGMLSSDDCLIALAHGGETQETIEVARYARRLSLPIVSITGKINSTLAKLSDVIIDASVREEACPLNLAPTASSTLCLALGDALAVSVMHERGFDETAFASVHPGGSLGKKLLLVKDIMRERAELNTASLDASFFDVMEKITKPNFGIIAVTDGHDKLLGVVTDGDIRRSLSMHKGAALQKTAKEIMNAKPKTITADVLAIDAFRDMENYKITSLFVTKANSPDRIVGLVRMHDLLQQKII